MSEHLQLSLLKLTNAVFPQARGIMNRKKRQIWKHTEVDSCQWSSRRGPHRSPLRESVHSACWDGAVTNLPPTARLHVNFKLRVGLDPPGKKVSPQNEREMKKAMQWRLMLLKAIIHAEVEAMLLRLSGKGGGEIKSRSRQNSGKAKRAGLFFYNSFAVSVGSVAPDFCPMAFSGYAPAHYGECEKRNPYLTSG